MDNPLNLTPYIIFVYMLNLLKKILSHKPFVIADPRDNSITISKQLFKHIKRQGLTQVQVFVFAIPENKSYGFTINPPIEQDTVLASLQYNSKHKSIGFESRCPTVNKIFYDYRLPGIPAKLSVKIHRLPTGMYCYEIINPNRP